MASCGPADGIGHGHFTIASDGAKLAPLLSMVTFPAIDFTTSRQPASIVPMGMKQEVDSLTFLSTARYRCFHPH